MPDISKQRKNTIFGIQQLDQWVLTVAEHLPHLSKPQVTVLSLWSFGMAAVKSCAITTVKLFLASLLEVKENTMRQRLREWCYDSKDKRGNKRVDVKVTSCFPFLMRWVMDWWQGTQVAIALDATALSVKFTVLSVSVVYRGCAIPVAWTITKGNAKGEWNRHWLSMLGLIAPVVPSDHTVLVLTDRGLYSPKLFAYICKIGWHPFMRINANGTFCPAGEEAFRPISSFVSKPGQSWKGAGMAFKSRRIPSTLVAYQKQGHKEAWFILTDLPPEICNACWYGMRAWIEQGFRTIKRGGWQWHGTRMTNPKRAQRLWLAISVSTLWLLSVGGEAEINTDILFPDIVDSLEQYVPNPKPNSNPHPKRKAARLRLVSIFRRGWMAVLVSFIRHEPLPLGRFIPESWAIPVHETLQNNTLGVAA
jgi:hypothetical protein